MNILSLNGKWSMQTEGEESRWNVEIPGSVLSCLLDNKVIDDPYDRDNEYPTRELFWKDYRFSRTFQVTEEILSEEVIELVCYGLDTLTEIYLNEELIATTENMHRTYRIPITDKIKLGENTISILCKSTLRYIESIQPKEGKEIHYDAIGAMKGNQYIRKAHSMFGWDWGPQLPDAGIFRDIQIECYSMARITYITMEQIHGKDVVELKGHIRCVMERRSVKLPDHIILTTLYAPDGSKLDEKNGQYFTFEIKQPKLWWPNGLGEHPLYRVESKVICSGTVMSEKTYRIGLRTLTVSREKDEWGSEFAFVINGIKIFSMGADYIPEDCIYSRITKERQRYLLESCIRANYNTIRIWGGGYYPSDEFYDMCDEMGLMVWQDLMYACNIYDLTEEFEKNIVAETMDNVRRLKNHASLALWCGNNELESAWVGWDDFKIQTPYLKADYIRQFEHVLPKVVKKEDRHTFYWPSSPSSGGCFDDPDDENRGDKHYWEVWHGQKPFSEYQKYYFRYCSEFGFQSFPGMKTVKTYTREEDRNIFSPVMECHQKNDSANGKIMFYLAETFRNPKDFESLLYDSQILQAIAIKSGVEHWRRNRGRCMGALYWQVNDNWPVASWSSIDYYGRWKALHYYARNFFAPIAGSIVKKKDEDSFVRNGGDQFSSVEVHIQNETRQASKVHVVVSLKRMDFTVLDKIEQDVEVPAFQAMKILERDYSSLVKRQPRVSVTPEQYRSGELAAKGDVFVEAVFTYEDGTTQIETETLIPYKHCNLAPCEVQAAVTEEIVDGKEGYTLTFTSDTYAAFVELDFDDADVIFSDNYFHITDKTPVIIRLNKEDIWNGEIPTADDLQSRLRIRTLRDTY